MRLQSITLVVMLFAVLFLGCTSDDDEPTTNNSDYNLVWSEEFNGNSLDNTSWEIMGRGSAGYNNYFTSNPALYEVKDGSLTLRGIVNNIDPTDTAQYLTCGVRTIRDFGLGKIEIRAKLGSAKGAWPAFWMMPSRGIHSGEIDIMEHLNSDIFVYQTVHTPYTDKQGSKATPPIQHKALFYSGKYNIYSVEITEDSVSFEVNGLHTFSYPRVPGVEDQYIFTRQNHYLMLDMQIGGDSWVGRVDPVTFPVDMQIDYVRFYQRKHN